MSYSPCPQCGFRFDQASAIYWTRLLIHHDIRPFSAPDCPIPDYATRIPYWCPGCKAPNSYPLDAPLAAA